MGCATWVADGRAVGCGLCWLRGGCGVTVLAKSRRTAVGLKRGLGGTSTAPCAGFSGCPCLFPFGVVVKDNGDDADEDDDDEGENEDNGASNVAIRAVAAAVKDNREVDRVGVAVKDDDDNDDDDRIISPDEWLRSR